MNCKSKRSPPFAASFAFDFDYTFSYHLFSSDNSNNRSFVNCISTLLKEKKFPFSEGKINRKTPPVDLYFYYPHWSIPFRFEWVNVKPVNTLEEDGFKNTTEQISKQWKYAEKYFADVIIIRTQQEIWGQILYHPCSSRINPILPAARYKNYDHNEKMERKGKENRHRTFTRAMIQSGVVSLEMALTCNDSLIRKDASTLVQPST